ncbi:hypothetical protein RN001_008073 [Aquatica leii]|uniref:Neprilysin n=1 Tax=Aquatica leii TaxID=1421715 RepID=A0AAN7P987_9COLE|nr:hypothetical protein RN001_008073 [Aquatica leii]
MNINMQSIFTTISWRKIEQNLKIVVSVLIFISFILAVALLIVSVIKNRESIIVENDKLVRNNVCLTPGCIDLSSKILQSMDMNVNPCTDFYNFACGNFMKNTYLHADQYLANSFQDIQIIVYQQIKNILENSLDADELQPFAIAKQFYKLCMNTPAIERDGLATINSILKSLDGWPVIEDVNWHDTKYDWKQVMYLLRKIGFEPNYFLTVKIVVESSTHVISLNKPEFGIDAESLANGLSDNATQNYFRYMVDVARMFGANQTKSIEELQPSLDLEISLAKIWLSSKQRLNDVSSQNVINIDKLQHRYPITDWKKYLKYLLDIPDFQITDDEIVVLQNHEYLDDLETLLNSTTKRTQANYIIWRVIHSVMPYLSTDFRNRRLAFRKETYGEQLLLPRWKECTLETITNFWESVTNAYLRTHSHQKTKQTITDMFSEMGKTFLKLIEKSNWMDNSTKENAYDKAKGLPYYTIFSDEMNDDALLNFYSTLKFNSENYLKSVLSIWSFKSNNLFKKIREPVTKKDKEWDVSMVYQMGVPQGLFQGLFFNQDRPKYVNYGAIGSIIGHLLTHVFDEYGRQYDKNLDLFDWWTDSTKDAYKNISQCVADHYNNYTVAETGRKLYSKHTIHEDIADITGLKVAYLTYNNWSVHNNLEPQLPGMNFTQNQMFWISAANMWCTKYRTEYLKYILMLKPFSPSNYRVMGSLRNLAHFSRDFNCAQNSFMNPEIKCKIW